MPVGAAKHIMPETEERDAHFFASSHLLQAASRCPPVNCLRGGREHLLPQALRGGILHCTNHVPIPYLVLERSNAKVRKHQVSVCAYDDVLRLDIAVDKQYAVDILDGGDDVSKVEPAGGRGQGAAFFDIASQVAAVAELHDHVQVLRVLQAEEETADERRPV